MPNQLGYRESLHVEGDRSVREGKPNIEDLWDQKQLSFPDNHSLVSLITLVQTLNEAWLANPITNGRGVDAELIWL